MPTFDPGSSGVDGGAVTWPTSPASSPFHAFGEGVDFAYASAPRRLKELWPEPEWSWDDPSCTWLYLQVGKVPDAAVGGVAQPRVGQCAWDDDVSAYLHDDLETFLAMGMMPYAAYHIRSVTTIEDEHRQKRTAYRIRYWVGFINHFSFYPGVADANYLDTNMPEPVWDPANTDVEPIGVRVEWFMGFLAGLTTSLVWEEDGQKVLRQRTWPCSATQEAEYEAYTVTSERERWPVKDDTSEYCFSNPDAYIVGNMTSLLGACIMGEVCVATSEGDPRSRSELVEEGFEELFGESVHARLLAYYFDPPGEAVSYDSDGRAIPARAALRACIKASDLVPVRMFVRRVQGLRDTDHGRWMFRAFDANLLGDVSASLSDKPCGSSCPED